MAFQEEYQSTLVMLLQNCLEEKQNTSILKLIEGFFDPNFLFLHPYIKLQIDRSKNGYLRWKFIFSSTQFKSKLAQLGAELKKCDEPLAGALFHYVIKKYSRKLRSSLGGVRTISSFDIADIKYLLARRYPSFNKLKDLMSAQASITKVQQDIYDNWAVISTTNPELIVEKYDGHVWNRKSSNESCGDQQEDQILRVYSYSDYLRFQDYSKRNWNKNRFNLLYSAKKVISYPCYKDYQNKRYENEDEEMWKKETDERLTAGMQEEP